MNIKLILLILLLFFINKNESQVVINSLDGYKENQIIYVYPISTDTSDPRSKSCKVSLGYSLYDNSGGNPVYFINNNNSGIIDSSGISMGSSLYIRNVLVLNVGTFNEITSTYYSSNGGPQLNTLLSFSCLVSSSLTFGNYVLKTPKFDPINNGYSAYVFFSSTVSATPPITIYSYSSISLKSQIVYAYSINSNHYYRVSFIGIIAQDIASWKMTYYFDSFVGVLSFLPPLNENVVKSSTILVPKKYGTHMSSYFAYPQIYTTITLGSSDSALYYPKVSYSTSDNTFIYAVPIAISGITTSTSNIIDYMIASKSKVISLTSYNFINPTLSTFFNSGWDNSDFSFYSLSTSKFESYNIPINIANGNNITISAFRGKISSNQISEHLGKYYINYRSNVFGSTIGFPFGYSGGNLSLYSVDIPILKHENSIVNYEMSLDNGATVSKGYSANDNIVNGFFSADIQFVALNEINSYLVKINYFSKYGFSNVKIMLLPNENCVRYYTFSQMNITRGDIYNGMVQFYFENFDTVDNLKYETFNVYIYDSLGSQLEFVDGNYYYDSIMQSIYLFKIPSFAKIGLDVSTFSSSLWEFSGIVSVVDPSINKLTLFVDSALDAPLILTIYPQIDPVKYYGVYSAQKYTFSNVKIPGGIIGGNIPFRYTLSTSKSNILYSSDGTLIEFNTTSSNFDLKGPVISEIYKINYNGVFGYNLTIIDSVNGFDHGYIALMGSVDGSIYNFTLSSETWKSAVSTKYMAKFDIVVSRECLFTQQYFIYQLYLVDTQGINSTFFRSTYYDYYQHTHPWSEISDFVDIINVTCPANKITYQNPSISNLTISKSFLDVFSEERLVEFVLTLNGDLLDQQFPKIYLTTATNEILQCSSLFIVFKGKYVCTVDVPRGFGYPLGISVSVYGIIGKNPDTAFIGYSSLSLLMKNITSFIQVHKQYGPPTIKDFSSSSSSIDSSSSFSSNSKDSSTNQSCNKDCGNLNQGYCNNDKCICIYPWYGDNCSKKIIVFPRPGKNQTDPTTVIVTNPTNDTYNESINAIINILEIREINIDGSLFKRYKLSNWTLTNDLNNANQHFYNSKIQTSDSQYTDINVTIEYYENETDIIFANYPLKLKPSTIKYTIYLDKYPFQSNFNTLELILATQLLSNNQSLCSEKDFQSDSSSIQSQDYIKLSIGHLSLEGRFIKRALVDNNPTLISNKLLSEEEYDTNNKATQLISISIPHYENIAIADPDFSVILDTKSKASDICPSQSSKLSKTKIAGIIIGVIGFSAVIISSVIYLLYKKKQRAIFHNKINNIQLNEN